MWPLNSAIPSRLRPQDAGPRVIGRYSKRDQPAVNTVLPEWRVAAEPQTLGRHMLRSSIFRLVDFCSRYAWWTIALSLILAANASFYTVHNFAIKTDVKDLFPSDLPWAQRALEYMKAFPQTEMLVVVDAPTPELVEQASGKLAEVLSHSDHVRAVRRLQGGPFFERNGLLYLPTGEV